MDATPLITRCRRRPRPKGKGAAKVSLLSWGGGVFYFDSPKEEELGLLRITMKKLFALLALSLSLCAPLSAQMINAPSMDDVPAIVTDGFKAYAQSGSNSAVDVWCKGSPMETDLTNRMTTATNLTKFEGAYGKYIGWELVKVYTLTPSNKVIFAVAKFEKGPLWLAFSCYKANDTWNIPLLGMAADAMKILPSSAFKE
jgi:hypothetical protein